MSDTQPPVRPTCKHCQRALEQVPDTWVPNRFNWVHSVTGYGDCGDKGEIADTYAEPVTVPVTEGDPS